MFSHYYVSAVIVACLIYFPTAFNGVLKRLLRYIFPRIVSVVYKASSCPPGLFPLIEDYPLLPTMMENCINNKSHSQGRNLE